MNEPRCPQCGSPNAFLGPACNPPHPWHNSPSEPAVWPPSTVPTQFPDPDKPAFARRNAEAAAPDPNPEPPYYCSDLATPAEWAIPVGQVAEPTSQPGEAFMSAEEFWKARHTRIILLVDEPIEAQYAAIFRFAEAYKNAALEHERRKNNKKI